MIRIHFLPMRFIVIDIFAYMTRYKKRAMLFDQKESAKKSIAKPISCAIFQPATRVARGSAKKRSWIRSTTPVLPSRMIDRSIGRNTRRSRRGSPRACPIRRNLRKRVCNHRIGARLPLPSPRTAFSFKSSFNQE